MSLATAIVLLWTQSTPDAALAVDHRAVDCTVAESYPRLLASVRPAGSVGRARVYFRAEGHRDWYSVHTNLMDFPPAPGIPGSYVVQIAYPAPR